MIVIVETNVLAVNYGLTGRCIPLKSHPPCSLRCIIYHCHSNSLTSISTSHQFDPTPIFETALFKDPVDGLNPTVPCKLNYSHNESEMETVIYFLVVMTDESRQKRLHWWVVSFQFARGFRKLYIVPGQGVSRKNPEETKTHDLVFMYSSSLTEKSILFFF